MSLLQTRGLSINFGGLWAVRNVDFDIDHGEVVGLIGPNGSGKTTFLNIISGLYQPAEGSVTLDGRDITGAKPDGVFRSGIARTYQSSRLCWDLSVADNVMLGLYSKQKTRLVDTIFRPKRVNEELAQTLQQAMDMLCYFNPDLVDRRYELTRNIPHIDRRRIEISRALVSKPKVLLLDEPTAGLNDEETMSMMHDIAKIREKMSDIAIIIIEHDMKVMAEIPQRIVVFNAGQKIAEGSYDEIIADPAVVSAYLGGAKK